MVEKLKYNGKEYPFRIGFYALTMFKNETGKSFDDLQKTAKEGSVDLAAIGLDEFTMFEPILYYSLISGLKFVDKTAKLDLERNDMFNMLEECFLDFAKLMPKFFQKEGEQTGEDGSPKKLQGNRHQRKIQEKVEKKRKSTTAKTTP